MNRYHDMNIYKDVREKILVQYHSCGNQNDYHYWPILTESILNANNKINNSVQKHKPFTELLIFHKNSTYFEQQKAWKQATSSCNETEKKTWKDDIYFTAIIKKFIKYSG